MQNQQVAVPKDTPAVPKYLETPPERPATRRSTRIQQLTGNSVRPPVFKELPPIKRLPRNRKVNLIQPTETALEPRESEISQRSNQEETQTEVGVLTESWIHLLTDLLLDPTCVVLARKR